jgi:N-acetylgalactosamine kinase
MYALIRNGYSKNVPELNKRELASLTARCEQFIGLQSGGMDQAISFLGQAYLAQYITFEPTLGNTDVHLPNDIQFIVSHTLVASNKKETAHKNYNRRVVECRLAVALLAQQLLKQVLPKQETLNWLQKQLNYSFEQMEKAIREILHKEPYSIDEVSRKLGMSVPQLREIYIKQIGQVADEHQLKLHDRVLHVITEAKRVIDFMNECNNPATKTSAEKLGSLMNDSQWSNATLYECSCPELDSLTSICRKSPGCLGARLTGAGWGGTSISLVREEHVPEFMESVWSQYYAGKPVNGDGEKYAREEVLFASKPSPGAALVEISFE